MTFEYDEERATDFLSETLFRRVRAEMIPISITRSELTGPAKAINAAAFEQTHEYIGKHISDEFINKAAKEMSKILSLKVREKAQELTQAYVASLG